MENNKKNLYIKTDDNKYINLKYIIWAKEVEECIYLCTQSNGCSLRIGELHSVCNSVSPESYNKLLQIVKK